MKKFYVNNTAQPNGDHEVHEEGCYWLKRANSVKDLGYHSNCYSAVREAKRYDVRANGCATCAAACHTS